MLAHDRAWRIGGANLAAARVEADLLFSPTPCVMPFGAVPVVATIHDATPFITPSFSKKIEILLRAFTWCAAKFCRTVTTASQCSKRDLVRLYGLPESRISVVYNGYDRDLFNPVAPDAQFQKALWVRLGIGKPYILHHGVIQPRKNLGRLIEAYRLMLSRDRNLDLELVLAGPLGWNYDSTVAAARDNAGGRGRVILTGALNDSDLALLVKGAHVVVVPSLYEGFCIPMVEAMACGIPTIASAASCLPEVSGNVLRYFDPLSVDDIATQMETAILDTGVREQLSRDGVQRASAFSWERCARETLEVLTAAGNNRGHETTRAQRS